jgi:hypothetical protein
MAPPLTVWKTMVPPVLAVDGDADAAVDWTPAAAETDAVASGKSAALPLIDM